MKYYLGTIRYRPNMTWIDINKLIYSSKLEEAEKKLRQWADKNMSTKDFLIIVTETL